MDDARRYCELGAERLERNEPEEALHLFNRAIEIDPENAEAWCGRGKACYDLGRLERADRDFRRAAKVARHQLEKRPARRRWWADRETRPYLRALHGRGLCRFWLLMYDDAARMFRRLLRLAPTDPLDVRFLLGETYFRMGEIDRAIREWQAVGDDPDVLYNLGLAYFYRGEFTRSVNAFRRAILENLYLVARITDSEVFSDLPRYAGTHYKGLDHEDAALDYLDRCADLWRGRPILKRWLRAIYEHPVVRKDVQQHAKHLRRLVDEELEPGERARIEGENTTLRSEARLAQTDRDITREISMRLFIPDGLE
ncbi:MAG: tetratricopeptide repeat protein [Planctomycetota bacterium]|nr:tetratricopeptide repeat protein [Planctomycetota bacterium]